MRAWSMATVRGREQVGHCTAPSAVALSMNSRMQPRQKVCPHPAVTGSCTCGSFGSTSIGDVRMTIFWSMVPTPPVRLFNLRSLMLTALLWPTKSSTCNKAKAFQLHNTRLSLAGDCGCSE